MGATPPRGSGQPSRRLRGRRRRCTERPPLGKLRSPASRMRGYVMLYQHYKTTSLGSSGSDPGSIVEGTEEEPDGGTRVWRVCGGRRNALGERSIGGSGDGVRELREGSPAIPEAFARGSFVSVTVRSGYDVSGYVCDKGWRGALAGCPRPQRGPQRVRVPALVEHRAGENLGVSYGILASPTPRSIKVASNTGW